MTFGEKIKQQRRAMGLSQDQLAQRLAVSRQAVSKWEMGLSYPDAENIVLLSELFGVTTDFLLKDASPKDTAAPPSVCSLPAVRASGASHRRYLAGKVTAAVFLALGTLGALVLGILSSVFPVFITHPVPVGQPDRGVADAGLSAFLQVHNLNWLFSLCIVSAVCGLLLLLLLFLLPKLLQKKTPPGGSA